MSRQRHEGKRGESHQAPTAQRQRRQTPKTAQTSPATAAGERKKRPASRAPQLITTAANGKPMTSPKAPPKGRKSDATRAAVAQRELLTPTTISADMSSDQGAIADAPVLAQSPEALEVPETPEIPEIPEMPEVPESPEIPQTPEEPEIPEIPEAPEIPEIPEIPEQPEEPTEPAEPDNLAGESPDAESDGPIEDEAATPVVPAATERRLPTLAVMAQRRHESPGGESGSAADKASESPQANAAHNIDSAPSNASEVRPPHMTDMPAPARMARRNTRNGRSKPAPTATPERPVGVQPPAGSQQTSVITRPVATHYNNRRKPPLAPSLLWQSYLPDSPWHARRGGRSHPQPLPSANFLVAAAGFQIFVMALMGLIGALVALNNGAMATWALVGAIIAGAGAAIAYAASEVASWQRFAPYVLVVSQLGLLTWAMLVLGPRPSLLALAPALIEVALLMSGTLLASVLLLGALLIYALFAGLTISIGLAPVIALDPTAAMALDVVFVVVGLLAALWLLLTIQGGRERAQATARARRHEADVLRNLMTQFRQETQDETGKLESALIQALKGHGIGPVPSEGMYRLLAETIIDTASRLEILQRDREERLRLEGSLRVLIRAVEREWLGIQPEWPGYTGTAIDELVALLRTPRLELTYQHETELPSITPRLIPIPTLAVEHNTPAPTSISRPLSSASRLASHRRARRPDLYSVPSADQDFSDPE